MESNSSSRRDFAASSLQLRRWVRTNLPVGASSLGFEVFISLALFSDGPDPQGDAALKSLYLSLPYSEQGIRLHLRRLEALGLVDLGGHAADTRFRRIRLSPTYWTLFDAYQEQARRLLLTGDCGDRS